MAKVIISLSVTETRPEQLRVFEMDGKYAVQIYSQNVGCWITQCEWVTARNAMRDALSWYPSTSEERQEAHKIAEMRGFD